MSRGQNSCLEWSSPSKRTVYAPRSFDHDSCVYVQTYMHISRNSLLCRCRKLQKAADHPLPWELPTLAQGPLRACVYSIVAQDPIRSHVACTTNSSLWAAAGYRSLLSSRILQRGQARLQFRPQGLEGNAWGMSELWQSSWLGTETLWITSREMPLPKRLVIITRQTDRSVHEGGKNRAPEYGCEPWCILMAATTSIPRSFPSRTHGCTHQTRLKTPVHASYRRNSSHKA